MSCSSSQKATLVFTILKVLSWGAELLPQGLVRVGSADSLPQILATRSTEIADAVTSAVARHVLPSSTSLTAEHERYRHLRARMIKRALDLAAAGEPYSAEDLRSYEDLGVLFARYSAPLSLLVASFDVGITAITRECWRIAPAESFAEMAQFAELAARMQDQARQTAVRGYLETSAGSGGRSARLVVAEALTGGEPALAAAQAIGERLAAGYLVLACAVADPARIGARQTAAIHRDIDGIPGALHCGDLFDLVVLLPVEGSQRPAEAAAADLAGRLRALTGQMVYAARAYRPGLAGIPAAAEEARRALSLVKAIPDAACRPYRMDELLVELAIARQPDIRDRLTAVLAPLDAGPDLRHTLEALLACDLDRERTARELCIHRRTLRYRMDRIRDLSGVDPDSAHGIQLLRAALTATRLADLEPQNPQPETAAPPSP
jgi:hypothetical protein